MSIVLHEQSHYLQAGVLNHSAMKFGNVTTDVLLQAW